MIEVKCFGTTLRRAVNPDLVATIDEIMAPGGKRTAVQIQMLNENLIEVSNTFDEVIDMIKNRNVTNEEKTV